MLTSNAFKKLNILIDTFIQRLNSLNAFEFKHNTILLTKIETIDANSKRDPFPNHFFNHD